MIRRILNWLFNRPDILIDLDRPILVPKVGVCVGNEAGRLLDLLDEFSTVDQAKVIKTGEAAWGTDAPAFQWIQFLEEFKRLESGEVPL